ncbi:helix-turn-helix domain-containing protein [Bacillus cihuensis]|uniref:helix-turn-helix domain-containing protein n=1 Tax=Bacillus cihuensis TaxID=1208599 RepID=UPI00040B1029|nr:helix-turn-helix domain-containing protein [Bacillus cihuensis]
MEKLNFETIKHYQSFKTIEEMDQSVRGFLYKHKAELSEGTNKVLTFIWRHSVKVIGVSFAKYDYIAKNVQLCRRTVIRAIKKLEELGIIKKIPTAKMNGKQGVNIIIIQSFQQLDDLKNNVSPQVVTAPVTPNKTGNKQSSLCENQLKPTNVTEKRNQFDQADESTTQELDESFLPESVHKEFVQAAKPFFEALAIYKLWNRVLIAYKKINLERPLEDLIEEVVSAFKQTIFAKQIGKIHSTFEGYFYSVLYAKWIVEKRNENRHLLYDFLEENVGS